MQEFQENFKGIAEVLQVLPKKNNFQYPHEGYI